MTIYVSCHADTLLGKNLKFLFSCNLDVYEQLKTQLWEDDAVTG